VRVRVRVRVRPRSTCVLSHLIREVIGDMVSNQ